MAALVWAFTGAGTVYAKPGTKKQATLANSAASQGQAPSAPPLVRPMSGAEVQLAMAALVGQDEAGAADAAAKLAAAGPGHGGATDALMEALAVGTSPQLAVIFIKALGRLRHPKSLQILALYANNRHAEVRVAACHALVDMPEDAAAGVLTDRLGDQDGGVRAVAAAGLATRKDARAAERLWKLVQKSDAGAAAPFGQLGPLDYAPKVAELRGTIDDSVLAATLGEFLKRPDANDRLRVDLVRTLGRVPGAEATTALVEYVSTVPDGDARPSKEEAEALIEQRSRS
jgi:HEAT repeat protein